MLFGFLLTRVMSVPSWVTPAIAFNNTTSLPLLLVQSLASTGILDSIDPSAGAIDRAKSYFLVNAMIGNSLTFAIGPKLLNGQEEDAPNPDAEKDENEQTDENDNGHYGNGNDEEDLEAREQANEHQSLLPNRAVREGTRYLHHGERHSLKVWSNIPSPAQRALDFLYQFFNAPLIGAAIGALIGLVPQLHRLFFNTQQEGGYLNAWLTASIQNVGGLFAALQVIVVGVKLSQSLLRLKRGEASGKVPWGPTVIVLLIRFIIWPLISIPLIWVLASKTNLLGNDPILWFSMMLMPAGPPALKLTALADVNGADEEEKMSIAKFLTVSGSSIHCQLSDHAASVCLTRC